MFLKKIKFIFSNLTKIKIYYDYFIKFIGNTTKRENY